MYAESGQVGDIGNREGGKGVGSAMAVQKAAGGIHRTKRPRDDPNLRKKKLSLSFFICKMDTLVHTSEDCCKNSRRCHECV